MRKYLLAGGAILSAFFGWSQNKTLSGFSDNSAKQEFTIEEKFDSYLKAANVGQSIQEMSAHPHHVGSPGDKAVADYIFNKFKSWGYDVQVETFYVLFPTPKTRLLEMTGPVSFKASLMEPAL